MLWRDDTCALPFTLTVAVSSEWLLFLLADTGPDVHRILLFGREANLDTLEQSNTWYLDGTFRTAPLIFQQIYVILCERLGAVHPIIYALLPNKTSETYERLFRLVKDLCPNANPQSLSCDFELAAFQKMLTEFPDSQIFGCFFHLTKNLKKQIARSELTQAAV